VMLATRSTLGSTFARIILFWVEESICDFVIVVTRRRSLRGFERDGDFHQRPSRGVYYQVQEQTLRADKLGWS
jgi:hypothetical protein